MMDHAAHRFLHQSYDKDGQCAASGRINKEMLDECMSHPFFQRHPPRSAWRLDFGADYADRMLDKYARLSPEDLMATLCAFTATAIVRAITDHVPDLAIVNVLIASGGGTRNPTLMRMLREQLPEHIRLTTSNEYGIPAQFKEATKFATLGFATLNHLANNIPACSGASQYSILGKIALAPRLAGGGDW
jgi:1,6-anhydro-N-acetylmuramate kinase